ncbi:MAG: AAA family ATPase [Elusimicrobia bacterium CG1_02_63_36]|nr:MAG: AAA family ATPase [Elusimicrobia bacterium CG1_02_63_36]PIP84680.1 MAG: AAA family ATPase [Elusimicrobia bacterium CG22_combo_CG10-13_8_21_14_all_63_91]PJA13234.1 MAG: AAA family ATPase [Elusimicrobia bacterium CG_4_10_14_0_2_um_filter_63_34]PJB24454.1 MAG: AAA family ATPase [Elusimicrobia bacterium CG_4_9_14_3_um_filter_62_55]
MLETLKAMILDFQEMDLQTGVPRRLEFKTVPGKATVCIGVRRAGKSTYLFQIVQRLLNSGVSRKNILYLNFFDDRLHGLQPGNLGRIVDAYYSLYPEKKNAETVYCFFDEVQAVAGWEPFIDRLMRTEKCEVTLTGSSARMLSKEIATQMRGRALSWEMFPFSFREFLDAKGVEGEGPLSTKKQLLIRKAFEQYWETGGFPEVVELDRRLRIKTHQEYFQAILFRDLVERHDVSHPKAVSDLAHRLADNTASLYSINKLTGYLKSLGHKVHKALVSEYLEWFEDAYFLFSVRIFDASLSRSQANPKKVYGIDHALVSSIASGILINSGHLFENLVFTALRRLHPDIYYYRTKSGREVDFVVPDVTGAPAKTSVRKRRIALVQACESLADPQTRKREVTSIKEAMGELKLKTSTIVTRNEEDQIEVDGKRIMVIPAWRFLLDLPETQN